MAERMNFLDRLTPTEKRGYYEIVDRIHDDGLINVNVLSEETNISVSSYRNLLAKMKKYGVAVVIGRGKKGTSVTIVDPILKDEAQSYDYLPF